MKATANTLWRHAVGEQWKSCEKSETFSWNSSPSSLLILPSSFIWVEEVRQTRGEEEDKLPPQCPRHWQNKTQDADKEVQSVELCARGRGRRCSSKCFHLLPQIRKMWPHSHTLKESLSHPITVVAAGGSTLSSGNLLCPSEAKVILWEPTKLKLLERRAWRVRGAVAAKRRDESVLLSSTVSPTVQIGQNKLKLTCQTVAGSLFD